MKDRRWGEFRTSHRRVRQPLEGEGLTLYISYFLKNPKKEKKIWIRYRIVQSQSFKAWVGSLICAIQKLQKMLLSESTFMDI